MSQKISALTLADITTSSVIPGEDSGDNFKYNLQSVLDKFSATNCGSIIPCSTSAWTVAQSVLAGLTASNSCDWQHRQLLISANTSTSGYVRQFLNMSGAGNWLPGTPLEIDCTKPWRISICGNFIAPSASFCWSLFVGGIASGSPPTSAATRSSKGWQIKISGTGTNTGTITPIVHNGTSAVSGAATSVNFLNGTLVNIVLVWLPGDGLYIYQNGTLISSVTTSDGTMITGTIASSSNGWATVLEHLAGNTGNSYAYVRPIVVFTKN